MTTLNNAVVNFRVAESLKAEAFRVIAQYGLTPSQMFNMILTEIATTKSIPVSLDYLRPNAQTLEAIAESESHTAEKFRVNHNESVTAQIFKHVKGDD